MAASGGAFLTNLVVTPLDVAKARLQAQIVSPPRLTPSCSTHRGRICHFQRSNTPYPLERRVLHIACSGKLRCMSCSRVLTPAIVPLTGTFHALRHIVQTEGIFTLWSGLSPTLALSLPSTVFYYSSYDYLVNIGQEKLIPSWILPMIAGASARTAAAVLVSPLELIRIRMQANTNQKRGILSSLTTIVQTQGVRSLFRGLNATLARDVPFSAIYWSCYELMKKQDSQMSANMKAFTSGAMAGAIAAILTQPFDVVKTVQQIESNKKTRSTVTILKEIVQKEGLSGVMTGWTARLAKITPACAIMISSYEFGKRYLALD